MDKSSEKKTILIVDDEKDVVEMIHDILDEHNRRLVCAYDGAEALRKCKNEQFDLIITDLNMPKVDGIKFIKELRGDLTDPKKHSAILIISGDVDTFKPQVTMLPQITVLSKPFSTDDLKLAVDKALHPSKYAEKEASGKKISVAQGEILLHQGDEGDVMYWLIKGHLQVFKTEGDKEIILGEVYQGELVGEMSFLDGKQRSATVRALEDSDLLIIPPGKFTKVLESQPGWFKSLVKTLSHRLRDTNKKVHL